MNSKTLPQVRPGAGQKLILGIVFFLSLASAAFAQSSAREAAIMTSLKSGNERFVAGKAQPKDFPSERLKVVKDQQPYAIVLACSDSQVPPEILFDESLGKLFVVRTAGHVVDPIALGSIEYAVKNLGVQMLLVMGHEGCSAVKATINGGEAPTNIRSLMQRIRPAVAKAHKAEFGPEDRLRNAIVENVRYQMQMAMYESDLLADTVKEGQLTIAGGVYNPSSGKVNVISTLLAVDRNPDRQATDHLAGGHDAPAPAKAVRASHNEDTTAASHGDSHAGDHSHGAPAGHGETRTAAAPVVHGSSHAPADAHAAPAHDAHPVPAHDAHPVPAHDAHSAPARNAQAAPAHAAAAHDSHAAPAHDAHAAPAHQAASHTAASHKAKSHGADSHAAEEHGAPAHKAESNHEAKGHDAEEHHAEPKESAHGKANSHAAPKAKHTAARSHSKSAKSAHASAGHAAVKGAKAPAKASAKVGDAHGKGQAEEAHKPAAKQDAGHGKKAEGGHRTAEKPGHGEKHAEKPAKTEKKSVKSEKGHGDHSYIGDDEDEEVLSLVEELQGMGWGISFVDGVAKNNIAEAINRFSKQISELQMSKILTSW